MQPITAEPDIVATKAHRSDRDVMRHRQQYPATPVTRQCIACGVVRDCDPGLPCGDCGASSFHLIPLAPSAR